jgi:hypothetical protein
MRIAKLMLPFRWVSDLFTVSKELLFLVSIFHLTLDYNEHIVNMMDGPSAGFGVYLFFEQQSCC